MTAAKPVALTDFAEHEQQVQDLKQTVVRLQKQLARSKGKVDDLVEATIDAATDAVRSYGPIGAVPKPKTDRRTRVKPEHALWVTSDWQGGKRTEDYNSQVMRKRVLQFADKCVRLTEIQRKDHPVKDCTIVMGGDMIEGLFNFPSQPFEIDSTLFEQFTYVSALMVDLVKVALANYEHVTVVAEWGNHGRIGSKRDAVPRPDNVDRMCFALARGLLKDEPRLTWEDSPSDIQRLVIGNYRALVIHGDEVGRNGFASPSTMVGHVNKWKAGGYRLDGERWDFRDVYTHHYHQHAEMPLPDGEGSVFQTGSTESKNNYALVHMASQASPSQRLHFVDPIKGRITAQYKVNLA